MSRLATTTLATALLFSVQAAAETVSIPLSGTATGVEIADMSVSPALLNAGNTQVGVESDSSLEIQSNAGPAAQTLTISTLEVVGEHAADFRVVQRAPITLPSGSSVPLGVVFAPSATGQRSAYLNIHHSGRSSPRVVLLRGTGTPQATTSLQPQSATTVNFGNVTSGATAGSTVVFKAVGSGPNAPAIDIYNVLINGEDADAFSHNAGSQPSLALDAELSSEVSVSTSITGPKTANLQIQHSGENGPTDIALQANIVSESSSAEPQFNKSQLNNAWPYKPTTLQFGPDGKLYVGEQSGLLHQYTVVREAGNTYKATAKNTTDLIQTIPNHDDNGNPNPAITERLITGLLVTGTADNPVVYVTSGDPRIGAGPSGTDLDLDTNSGVISRLTVSGNQWSKQDLVRGLPRSEENHQPNGMQISADGSTLFVAAGGHTNMGAPSNNFARLPEFALSGAILSVDLNAIGNSVYDLPTLDDEDRAGSSDQNDPFGGNNGKNMAKLVQGGPVQVYAPGFRNAYDVLLTADGRMYSVDNGPNSGWGGEPPSNCLNDYQDNGAPHGDGLHFITGKGYYGGHPNPTRGNKANTFNNSNPQSPIEGDANPIECEYKTPGSQDGALHVFNSSTNGLTEYTANNFGGAMQGNLLAASFDKAIYRIVLNAGGNQVTGIEKLFENLGIPLDVTATGTDAPFPGTVWVADYSDNKIHIFEPVDY